MRRPGFLGNTNYWFGDVKAPNFVANKLEEIRLANLVNGKALTKGQISQRLADHLKNPRALSQGT